MDQCLVSMEPAPRVSSLEVNDDRKKIIKVAVATLCYEVGFALINEDVLELLVNMFIAFLTELSQSTKLISEHTGRTRTIPSDVMMAMIGMGRDFTALPAFLFRAHQRVISAPMFQLRQNAPKILQTGGEKQLLPYIPDHFPPFPDPHSYISTPTVKQPMFDYQTLREKSSTQKRNVERGLTNFMARTDQSQLAYSLFPNDKIFPLIGIKTDNVAYLSALLQKDETHKRQEEKIGMCQLNSLIRKKRVEIEQFERHNQVPLVDIVKELMAKEEMNEQLKKEQDNIDSLFIRPPREVDDFDLIV